MLLLTKQRTAHLPDRPCQRNCMNSKNCMCMKAFYESRPSLSKLRLHIALRSFPSRFSVEPVRKIPRVNAINRFRNGYANYFREVASIFFSLEKSITCYKNTHKKYIQTTTLKNGIVITYHQWQASGRGSGGSKELRCLSRGLQSGFGANSEACKLLATAEHDLLSRYA